jgi:hypothetical protein
MVPEQESNWETLEKYRLTDSIYQGRVDDFMTLDSWMQDGNFAARFDNFGPEMEQEAPPTLNGMPLE